ncbi:diguanylate cyclase (GGDEF) domain-containing protein [Hathewaya proteolytica DSM 3090]|uniref:Diguanylate cyclase (GGDEF) domain-containing protein n=1 Tax=Hathewaya proteolytica DSM 3090 TaxID=1121331 RepID=A0A1M6MQR4_9CLOT|nr:tetratricopeptide repeat-containing diguanylate cyclase [Hathewaya proteolytica]SHJ85848.1 diguanylate cyclase (GGDEF) domain-containing protein [Hathewaya proteolytica DSM 3090]
MDVINNKYRIVKKLNEYICYVTYLVYHISNEEKYYELSLLKNDSIPSSYLTDFERIVSSIKRIHTENIVSIIDYDIIQSIDGKLTDDIKYYYVCDYDDNQVDLSKISSLGSEKISEIFIDLCQSIALLHAKERVYENICFENLMLKEKNGNFKLVLRDMYSSKFIKYEKKYSSYEDLSELSRFRFQSSYDKDMCALGVLLVGLINGITNGKAAVEILRSYYENEVYNHVDSGNSYDKLMKLAFLMVFKKEIFSVRQAILKYNSIFNASYPVFKNLEPEQLNFDTELTSRQEYVDNVVESYNRFKIDNSAEKVYVLYGEEGIGKTKVLKSVAYYLQSMGERVFSNINKRMDSKDESISLNIISKMIENCPDDVMAQYEDTINDILVGMKNKSVLLQKNSSGTDKIRMIFINRAASFIREYCKARPIIIIIDDITSADDITVDLIKYICSMNCKVFIIMACRCEKLSMKSDFEKWITEPSIDNNVIKIQLKPVGRFESDKIVSQILGVKELPSHIGANIYERSKGNPLLIEETIKNLYVTKRIYTDKDTGMWRINTALSSVELTDIKDAAREQLKGLDAKEIYALQLLSIFKNPVSSKIIEVAKSKLEIYGKENYSKLINGNILEIVYDEDDYTVDFNNRYMKTAIRNTINKELHEYIAMITIGILEDIYNLGDISILDELIYQVDTVNDKKRIIKYNVENAHLCLQDNLENKALTYFDKALKAYNRGESDNLKINIMISMGRLYFKQFNFEMCQLIYKQAFEDNSKLNDRDTSVVILENLCNVYECTRNEKKLELYISKMENLLEDNCDNYNAAKICHLKATYHSYKNEIKQSKDLCLKALDIIKEDYDVLKAGIYNTLCYVYITIGHIEEALKTANMAIKYAVEYDNKLVLYKAYTNLTVIYCDYYQNAEKTVKYSKLAKDISEEYGEIINIIRAKNNLAISYFYGHEYDKAMRECKENRELMGDSESFYNIYCNVINCNCNVILEDICEAYDSYRIGRILYEKIGETEESNNKLEHYSIMMCFNLWIGDYENTFYYAEQCNKINLNDIIIFHNYIRIYEASANIFIGKKVYKNFQVINHNLKRITNYSYSLNIITRIAKHYVLRDREEEIIPFINLNLPQIEGKIEDNDKVDMCSYNLLKALVEDNYDKKIRILKGNLRLSRNKNLNESCYITALYMRKLYLNKEKLMDADICLCIAAISVRKLLNKCTNKCYETYTKAFNLEHYFKKIYSSDKYFVIKGKPVDSLYNLVHIDGVTLKMDSFRAQMKIRKFKNIYNYYDNYIINDFTSIVEMLNGDDYHNINVLNKYLSHTFFADKSVIVSNSDDRFQIVDNTEDNTQIDIKMDERLRRCKTTRQIVKEYEGDFVVTFCIPIIVSWEVMGDEHFINDRRKTNVKKDNLVGYIYIEINPIFESYVEKRIFKIGNVIKLAGIILDKINLKNSAFYDRLTGALTRKYLDITLKEALEESKKNRKKCSILMLDLDKFKYVNDNFGHQVGDKVLRETSELIRNKIRSADIFGRYGGEELLVVLPNSDKTAGVTCAEKLRKSIEESKMLGERRKVTVSIGVSCFPEDGQDSIELIEKADKALYIAKNRGRNQVVAWCDDFGRFSHGMQHLSSTVMKAVMQEEKRFSYVLEIIKLIKEARPVSEKIEKVITIISDVTESEFSNLFLVDSNECINQYIQVNDNLYQRNIKFNENLIRDVKNDKEGIFMVDWDNPFEVDPISNFPDWKSVIVSPVLYSERVLAIVYLIVSTKTKEFSYEDYSMVNLLLSMATPLFMEIGHQKI